MKQLLTNYILNIDLTIDKATFFTIIIGQITIYGILLTFYQFVTSYQDNEKFAIKYLGYNIIEYSVKKRIGNLNKIISSRAFELMMVMEIIYKPFTMIYGDKFSSLISIMNFIWFVFVFVYFILFSWIFFRCAKIILMLERYSDVKRNDYIIKEINKDFLKKTVEERRKLYAIELLKKDFVNLNKAIQVDDNIKLQEKYNDFINVIFEKYIARKKYEISNIENGGKIVKNQIPWIYNSDCEIYLLQEILDEMYFKLDEQNLMLILKFYVNLINQNLKRAELAGYSKIKFNRYDDLSMKVEEKIFDVSTWKDVILKIYQKLSDEKKKKSFQFLSQNINQNFYKEYINDFIKVEIDNIFTGKREQKDFIKIFGQIIKDENFNEVCSQIIIDRIICYNKFDAREIIGQLNKKNCAYIFSYIVLYYSIYRFRFEWEYININVLRTLWKKHSNMQDNANEIIQKIRNSNIGHRFEEKMYFKLVEYMNASADSELFNVVYNDKVLDMFYVWVIKISVVNQEDLIYPIYEDNLDINIQIAIVNELSKHDELMEFENIYNWVQYMRYNTFAIQKFFPPKMKITFRSLLLANINATIITNYVHTNYYYYSDIIGEYLLVKLHELPDEIKRQKQIKEIVKSAFIANNMNVDEYISMIEKECHICRYEINYVQKEKMREYLIKTF